MIVNGDHMNTKIVNQLIFLNNEYEKLLEGFAEKTDFGKIFEFECENYVQRLTDDVVPLIYSQLQTNPQDKLDFYLPYIKSKYHGTVAEELKTIKINDEKRIYNLGKKISKQFNAEILLYKNFNAEEKNKFIDDFYDKNKNIFEEILDHEPAFFVQIISELRNPKIQYKILNKNKESNKKFAEYLLKVEKEEFEKILKENVFYPTDIQMDDYYKKWIGKDKIHVKFLKSSLGERYEYAKMFSKMSICGKKPKSISLN